MSRPLRIEYPGAWYHIMNRGRRRERIFLDSSDYQAFVDLLANVSDMFKAQVAAFALMSNHYHVLLCTPEGNINKMAIGSSLVLTYLSDQVSLLLLLPVPRP